MCHYYDGAPRRPGCSKIRRKWGCALVQAYRATGDSSFLERAKELAEFIVSRTDKSDGGYFDRGQSELAFFGARLTLIDQNGVAASFFFRLAAASGEPANTAMPRAGRWAPSRGFRGARHPRGSRSAKRSRSFSPT